MRIKGKAALPLILGVLLAAPVGFAIGQVADGDLPLIAQNEDHTDPDPETDPVQRLKSLRQAARADDPAAEKAAAATVRDEILSRMPDDERAPRTSPTHHK